MTERRPLLSVVITNHDYGRFVGDAIRSAMDQQHLDGPVEVVVVDDGSSDDSPTVLAGFGSAIDVIRLEGRGQAGAMNAGFERTRAPVVIFLDADDRLHEDVGARVLPRFDDPAVARVHYPLRRVDVRGEPIGGTVPPVLDALPDGDLRRAVLARTDDLAWQPTSGNAYARAALERVFPLPEAGYRISADHLVNAQTALLGRVERLGTPAGDYRLHGANADARSSFDLERTRGIVARSAETQGHVRELAGRLGLASGPARRLATRTGAPAWVSTGSVTTAANRLVSLRLAGDEHPLEGDVRRTAWIDGVRAALRRDDLPWTRRGAAGAFVTALAIVPRALLPRLAGRFLRGTTDGGPHPVPASTSSTR